MTQHACRLQNADQALELYDFGPNKLTSADGWDEDGPDQWSKNVYLTDPQTQSEGRVLFIVKFDSINNDVIDAYHKY
jgi:hypothetical protein